MIRSRSFRPSTLQLEDRLALSGMTAWVAPATATITPGEIYAVRQEQTAISTFAKGYQTAVQSILMSTATPSDNRAAFDAQVGTLLTTLQTGLENSVKYLPNSAALTTDIDAIITGGTPSSLESKLDAIPTPTGPSSYTFAVFGVKAAASIGLADLNLTSDALGYGTITPIS